MDLASPRRTTHNRLSLGQRNLRGQSEKSLLAHSTPAAGQRPPIDLAADATDQPTLARAQDAQFSTVAVELFGVGAAPRHHRRAFGDAEVGLPQPHPVSFGLVRLSRLGHDVPWVKA